MVFGKFAGYLARLEGMSSRNEMTEALAQMLGELTVEETDKAVNMALGRLAPAYAALEIGMAEKMMARVVAKVYGISETEAWREYKRKGDWGIVVAQMHKAGDGKLSISDVYEQLVGLAKEGGAGSQERKVEMLADLVGQLDPVSAKYVVRIPTGRLRLGFSDVTILDALSVMESGNKGLRKEIEAAFNVSADIGKIAREFKKNPKRVRNVEAVPGIPVRPALSERLPTAEKIVEKLGNCVSEPKYDGVRVQVHVTGRGEVSIFSRNLENTTLMYPDLLEAAEEELPKGVIFDGEAIAYDPKTNKFLPFQETSQRKRKHGIEEKAKELPLKVFLFDVLFAQGRSLLSEPYKKRREILSKLIDSKDRFVIADQKKVESADKLRQEFERARSDGLEGLMVKKTEAIYQAGARSYNWVKFKKHTENAKGSGGLVDTIDCVVMGVYRGRGKRAGFGVGAFLVGVKGTKQILTVAKIGTGLSDEQWREMDKWSRKLKTGDKPEDYEVDKNLYPDVWMKPELIVEIMADEITRSPIHTAGIALRFPRLVRFRDDKGVGEITTLSEVEKLQAMQVR